MALGKILLDLLFPARCPVCDGITDRIGENVCRKCRHKIVYIKEPYCMKCGKQLKSDEQEYCNDCKRTHHYYIQGTALYDLHTLFSL